MSGPGEKDDGFDNSGQAAEADMEELYGSPDESDDEPQDNEDND